MVNSLLDRIDYIKTQYSSATLVDQKVLNQSLQKLHAEFAPLDKHLCTPLRQQLLLSSSIGISVLSKPHKELVLETNSILDMVSELRERVSKDDLRLQQLKGHRNKVISHLNYYHMVLKDLLKTITAQSNQSKTDKKQLLKGIRLARHKLTRYQNFPQSYIAEFDEISYLSSNTDIRAAVLQDAFPSGLAHFVAHGLEEVKNDQRNRDANDPIHLMVFPSGEHNFDEAIAVKTSPSSEESLGHTSAAVYTSERNSSFVFNTDDDSIQEAVASLQQGAMDDLNALRSSGVMDDDWYRRNICEANDSCAHYYLYGATTGANPNALFDHVWYSHKYLSTDTLALEAVLHYLRHGADAGLWPGPDFEPNWYREANNLTVDGKELLAHYICTGRALGLSPNSVFDKQYYLDTNADIAESKIDAFEHFNTTGWQEGRNPSVSFDLQFYQSLHLEGKCCVNPVSHYLQTGRQNRLAINALQYSQRCEKPALMDIASNSRFFSNKGPDFEEPQTIRYAQKPLAKAVAFFLPQFYAFAENDKWWGEGFTEWRNVARGTPRFEGHYQPRIPRDLGFYNLTDESTLIKQSELALANGIEAFCFYYYWFNGKRLMDKPLDLFANSNHISQDFCIMWANENWTRTWDGFDSEVLIKQDYREEDEDDFIADTLKYFENDRYLTVNKRPLFILYRPGLIDSATKTVARWRTKWKASGGFEPIVLMVQGFNDNDPTQYGLDGAIEFPPHKVAKDLPNIHHELNIIDPNYAGNVVAYNDVVNRSLAEPAQHFPLIKTVSPHWDNDACREGRGMTLQGSTPLNYQRWLGGAINYSKKHPFYGESLVFVNAWNEWAESAYLEPDVHYGHAYLNATRRALHGVATHNQRESILILGHDAHQHGAQMLLLNIADTFKNQFGIDVVIALKSGGPLVPAYEQIGNVYILDKSKESVLLDIVTQQNFTLAITNTCVTGDLIPILKKADLKVVSLVHELPRLIEEYGLEEHVNSITSESDHVVFASKFVQNRLLSFTKKIKGASHILPQGTYKEINTDPAAAKAVRLDMGITSEQKMVLNVGYADMRKGFDLFLSTAREFIQIHPDVHFVWVGGMTEELKHWTLSDLDGALANRVHIVDFTDNVSRYYNAADCFYLSSREDPYPSVVLEALAVGCPAVIYRGATGLDQLIDQHGVIVDKNCNQQISSALTKCLFGDTAEQKVARKEFIRDNYKFDEYCFSLLKLVRPDIHKVSVVVPNYNYAQYIEERLLTIFEQKYPLFEIIVLEDNSPDKSLNVIRKVIANSGRKVRLIVNETNSGSTFSQWEKGLEETHGDLLWIAEADDLASDRFVCELASAFTDDTDIGFTDSKQIDSEGNLLGESYSFYYTDIDADLFRKTQSMKGEEFVRRAMTVKNSILNVSSVIWRTQALRDALETERDAVLVHRLVGDWRIYISVLLGRDAQITYLSKSLNTHRRHANSVTHALDAKRHIDEVSNIHKMLNKSIKLPMKQQRRMNEYIQELSLQFGLGANKKSVVDDLSLAWKQERKIG